MILYFVTLNVGKLREAEVVLKRFGIEVKGVGERKLEVQSDSLEEVVMYAAESLRGRVPEPFVVEDSGLFIERLRGFPGPCSSYVFKTIGCEGILKLMEGVEDRRANFICSAALVYDRIRVFSGEVCGWISYELRGAGGFGFDPIFVPEGYERTFAEMSLEEKCAVSHRARALEGMARFLSTARS